MARKLIYSYRCPCGETNGVWPGSPPADPTITVIPGMGGKDRPVVTQDEFRCRACDRHYGPDWMLVSEEQHSPFFWNQRPEVPEHFNRGLGQMVYGREHLEHLQAVHGCEDAYFGKPDKDGALPGTPRDFYEQAEKGREQVASIDAGTDGIFATPDESQSSEPITIAPVTHLEGEAP